MQHQTPQVDRVVLITDKGSALADRIAADLQAKGLSVVQRELREPPDSEQAAIFLVESPPPSTGRRRSSRAIRRR
jgi:hypothetical protein